MLFAPSKSDGIFLDNVGTEAPRHKLSRLEPAKNRVSQKGT